MKWIGFDEFYALPPGTLFLEAEGPREIRVKGESMPARGRESAGIAWRYLADAIASVDAPWVGTYRLAGFDDRGDAVFAVYGPGELDRLATIVEAAGGTLGELFADHHRPKTRRSEKGDIMTDDFGPADLLAALDQTEAAGVPPRLVERLRVSVAIADAAREFVATRRSIFAEGEAERERLSRAYERLAWMIDAERFGWDPGDFRSERDAEG